MYAVRYGDHRLMRFLHTVDLLHEHPQSQYSLIHAACFNNDVATLKVLIDELGKDVNQFGANYSDNCPLKYAYKVLYSLINRRMISYAQLSFYVHGERITSTRTYGTISESQRMRKTKCINYDIYYIQHSQAMKVSDNTDVNSV
jgi:hypothetical protein